MSNIFIFSLQVATQIALIFVDMSIGLRLAGIFFVGLVAQIGYKIGRKYD
jgi:hypothetical protein